MYCAREIEGLDKAIADLKAMKFIPKIDHQHNVKAIYLITFFTKLRVAYKQQQRGIKSTTPRMIAHNVAREDSLLGIPRNTGLKKPGHSVLEKWASHFLKTGKLSTNSIKYRRYSIILDNEDIKHDVLNYLA